MNERVTFPAPSSLRRFAVEADAAVTLVCLPHAGGSAAFYARLARAMSPQVDTLSVQYPGRMERQDEPFAQSIAELADDVVGDLKSLNGRPIALFGHSMGSIVAFEVAQRLQALGQPPMWLFASGRNAPSQQRRESTHLLDDPSLIDEVRKLGGTDPRLFDEDDLVQLILPVIRADYLALEAYRYQPRPPLSCPVTTINGQVDAKVSADAVAAWRRHTTGRFESLTMRGGHFYLVDRLPEVIATIVGRLPVPAEESRR